MRCASCFAEVDPALLDVAGAACRGCGAALDGGAPQHGGAAGAHAVELVERAGPAGSRPCPRCAGALLASPLGDGAGALLGCRGCGGAFVDVEGLTWAQTHPTELAESDAARPSGHGSPVDERYIACPVCGAMMNRRVFGKRSGVVVDVCAAHGTWFDAGELERGAAFLASGGLARVARSEAEERRERSRGLGDPRVSRAHAEAQAALVGEAAREGHALGRREGRWESRWDARDVHAAGGFLAWLRSLLD